MPSLTELLQQGPERAWLFIPSAIILGALHGLEPGHSKTMMASFIIAIRGTVRQAVLLGLAATLSHTAVIWAVALTGLYFGSAWYSETSEPYFQMVSAVIIFAIAAWMIRRTWMQRQHMAEHDHDHHHDHGHHDDTHERAHAREIEKRFANRNVTTGQVVMFGLTGGLIPCPAAITVLLICLQVKQIDLGIVLVLCFSIGLAAVLVTSGVVAAWGLQRASLRWPGLGALMARAPYASGALVMFVGIYVGWQAFLHLPAGGVH